MILSTLLEVIVDNYNEQTVIQVHTTPISIARIRSILLTQITLQHPLPQSVFVEIQQPLFKNNYHRNP